MAHDVTSLVRQNRHFVRHNFIVGAVSRTIDATSQRFEYKHVSDDLADLGYREVLVKEHKRATANLALPLVSLSYFREYAGGGSQGLVCRLFSKLDHSVIEYLNKVCDSHANVLT